MPERIKILLVEDDLNFGSVLRDYLSVNGYEVTLCEDGVVAFARLEKGVFDLCITDIMMPYKDGFTLAEEIKQFNNDLPIIFLTAKTLKEDMLRAYKIGADDYIIKPFDSELLLYKIQAVLNRKAPRENEKRTILLGKYIFSYPERTLLFNDQRQKLSPKEAQLLQLLCEHKDELLPREKALKKIWGDNNYFNGRSMDVYITKLRKCLAGDASIEIENLHGTGFKLIVKGANNESR